MPGKIKNLVGQRFGKLVVTALGQRASNGKVRWICQCDCGNQTVTLANSLTQGRTTSCGCVHRQRAERLNLSHGMSKHPAFKSYRAAKTRCTNPNQKCWKDYGGRGIEFRLPEFPEFWAAMGGTWFEGATIERENTDGHYEMGNVKWATRREQNSNTRANRLITYGGVTKTLAEWARAIGIHNRGLSWRIDRWGVDEALSRPINRRLDKT